MHSFLKEFNKYYKVNVISGITKEKEFDASKDKFENVIYNHINRPSEKGFFAPLKFLFYFIKFNFKILKLIKQDRLDLILTSMPRYELLFAINRFKKNNISYILDITDVLDNTNYQFIIAKWFIPNFLAKFIAGKFEKQKNKRLKKAIEGSLITIVSWESIEEYYTKLFPELKNKFMYVGYGVDLDYFPKPQTKKKNNKLRILYVGNFTEKDYLAPIINELGNFKDQNKIELVFVGDGRNIESIKDLIKKNKLEQISKFYGKVHHSEIYKFAEKADVGIIMRDLNIPTMLPVSIIEYMAMCLPVIVNDYAELSTFIKKTEAGFVVNNINELNLLLEK
jgi:glycosyltransferase involved in cell wall biosynthesis